MSLESYFLFNIYIVVALRSPSQDWVPHRARRYKKHISKERQYRSP